MKKTFTLMMLMAMGLPAAFSQSKTTPAIAPPALAAIKETDLKKDIFELASDAFRGRRAGTLDEMRAAVWTAQKAQEIGLKPAGDDGTYFQFFNMRRVQIDSRSTMQLNGSSLALWRDFWPTTPVTARFEAPIVWLNSMADTTQNLQGKVAVVKIVDPKPMPVSWVSLYGYRYTASAIRQQSMALRRKGVVAVIMVANDVAEKAIDFIGNNFQKGSYANEGLRTNTQARTNFNTNAQAMVPVILVRASVGSSLQQGGTIRGDFRENTFLYPSVNVVAKVSGTDAQLRKEYVLFSGHHDHDGVGYGMEGRDSIWNGADDNASVTVGMLAIARAWVAKPGKRSALFVWHGAEERGLLGSRWYAVHPTVPKEDIVAVLNGDMIGRNNIDTAALLGSTAHRNSQQLVDMAMKANTNLTHFKVDFSWDAADHPEGWYRRSDHLPYADEGIPSIFFTTLLHPDYHTPRDEPQYINIAKLAKMSRWMYATGWLVSQAPQKLALDAKK
ncbi:M28 family peptidase [Mucilaginibacter robiniae]|uniref:M28 family peptidase n=1 Tax=Mucilaginibacter robiniae TaxID=2728022 RepID=A0A7L5E4X0_9SPHI|nr:M28 family peptidase [Mucilaginibacter robiniae]QJD97427.1 M28 family peptidase [Mucilaginibacter robiniae]